MIRTLLAAAFTALVATTSMVSAQDAGLAERRAVAAYEKDQYPALQKKIQDAAGFPVPITVDWLSLALPGETEYYTHEEFFLKTIFEPLELAMKDVAQDEMGKEALKAKLKAITIHYADAGISASDYKQRVKFEDGMLDINFRPFTNGADVKERADAIIEALNAKL
jgi:hypothetical protein